MVKYTRNDMPKEKKKKCYIQSMQRCYAILLKSMVNSRKFAKFIKVDRAHTDSVIETDDNEHVLRVQ